MLQKNANTEVIAHLDWKYSVKPFSLVKKLILTNEILILANKCQQPLSRKIGLRNYILFALFSFRKKLVVFERVFSFEFPVKRSCITWKWLTKTFQNQMSKSANFLLICLKPWEKTYKFRKDFSYRITHSIVTRHQINIASFQNKKKDFPVYKSQRTWHNLQQKCINQLTFLFPSIFISRWLGREILRIRISEPLKWFETSSYFLKCLTKTIINEFSYFRTLEKEKKLIAQPTEY